MRFTMLREKETTLPSLKLSKRSWRLFARLMADLDLLVTFA
jgi:hypothetical protein